MQLLVVTGAGVSAASGIPLFRVGADAVWAKDTTEMGTSGFFRQAPVAQWRWYQERFRSASTARPNAAHFALARLEEAVPDFLLVTQNIDKLHEEAGSRKLVKVHGSADRVRCSKVGCKNAAPSGSLAKSDFDADFQRFSDDPRRETLPSCPACGALLRPHVLWFDETYTEHDSYQFGRVAEFASAATDIYFIGTTLQVGVCAMVLEQGTRRARPAQVTVVDPDPRVEHLQLAMRWSGLPDVRVDTVKAKAEKFLPRLVRELGR